MLVFAIFSIFLTLHQGAVYGQPDVKVSPLNPPNISDRAFEGKILEFLEKIRGIMKNGDPEQDIPPLEPLPISHYDFDFIIDQNTKLAGYIDQILIRNVSDFIVSECEFDMLKFQLTLGLRFNTLLIDGFYKGKGAILGDAIDAEGAFTSNTTNLDVGLLIHLGSNLNRTVIKELGVTFVFSNDEIAYTNVILNEENGLLDNEYMHPFMYRIRDEIFPLIINTLTLVGSDLIHDITLDEILKMFLDLIGGAAEGYIYTMETE